MDIPVLDSNGNYQFEFKGDTRAVVTEGKWQDLDVTTHSLWEALGYNDDGSLTGFKRVEESNKMPGKTTEIIRTGTKWQSRNMLVYHDEIHEYGIFWYGTKLDLVYYIDWKDEYQQGNLSRFVEHTYYPGLMEYTRIREGIEYYGLGLVKSYLEKEMRDEDLIRIEDSNGALYDEYGNLISYKIENRDPVNNTAYSLHRADTKVNIVGQTKLYIETMQYSGNELDYLLKLYTAGQYNIRGDLYGYYEETLYPKAGGVIH